MRNAVWITSSTLGIYAGLLGIEHGTFEILQGNIPPGGLMINAIGVPCQPAFVWHACYPALTIVPNLLVTGVLAILAGTCVAIWSAAFVQRRHGGLVLLLASTLMLVTGGGFVSWFVGIIAGAAGTRIDAPVTSRHPMPRPGVHFLAAVWPWTLVIMGIWLPGSWILGYFFARAMLALSFPLFLLFDVGLPLLTAFSAITWGAGQRIK